MVGYSTAFTLTNGIFPSIKGKNIPAFAAYSKNDGNLASYSTDNNLMQQSSVVTINNILPATFFQSSKQNCLKISFTTSVSIYPGNVIQINYQNSILLINTASSSCLLSNATNQFSCKILLQNLLFSRFQITSTLTLSPGQYTLSNYGIDIPSIVQQTTPISIQIFYQDSSDSKDIIQESPYTGQISFGASTNVQSIQVSSQFTNLNAGAQTTFYLNIQINNIQINYYMFIHVDYSLFSQQNNKTIFCQILDGKYQLTHQWQNLTYTDLSNIYIFPKQDSSANTNSLILKCYGIQVPQPTNQYGVRVYLRSKIDYSIILQANPFTPNTYSSNQASNTMMLFQKTYDTPGSVSNTTFQLRSLNHDIDIYSRIIIDFPFYYPPQLSPNNPIYCYINNIATKCSLTDLRRIILINPAVQVKKYMPFYISILGAVSAQKNSIDNFFIALDKDSDDSSFTSYEYIPDQIMQPSSSIVNLIIFNAAQSNTYIRASSTLTFTFRLDPSIQVLEQFRNIAIDFPVIWQNLLDLQPPTCTLNLQGDQVFNYAGTCQTSGQRLTVPLAASLQGSQNYTLYISNLLTPDQVNCNFYRWVISVVDINNQYTQARSFITSMNYNYENYTKNPSQVEIQLQQNSQYLGSLNLIRGIYSDPIQIVNLQGNFLRSFSISLSPISNNYVQTSPSIAKVSVGQTSQNFMVGAYQSTPLKQYTLLFQKSDDGGYYTNPQYLIVNVNFQQQITISPFSNLITIPLNAPLFLLEIKLSQNYPTQYITLTFTIQNQTQGLYFTDLAQSYQKFNQSINLTVDNPKQLLILSSIGGFSSNVSSNIINVTLSGADAPSFNLQYQNIRVQMINSQIYAPSQQIVIKNSSNQANQHSFQFMCNDTGAFFYSVRNSACKDIDQQTIINGLNQTYDSTDICETQYGYSIVSTVQNTLVQITNLRQDHKYKMLSFCSNGAPDLFSNLQISSFQTPTNGGKVVKVDFQFDSTLTLNDKSRLACYLAIQQQIPYQYVVTQDNVFCQQAQTNMRLLQTYSNSVNYSIDVSSQSLNSTQKVSSSLYNISYYYLPLDYLSQDLTFTQIVNLYQNSISFIQQINNQIAGLPNLVSVQKAQMLNVSLQQLNQFSLQLNITSFPNIIQIQNISLNAPGYVYISLNEGLLDNNTYHPSALELRMGASYNGTQASQMYQFGYSNATMNVNFTNLKKNTSYIIYWICTPDNPSIWAVQGQNISYLNISTTLPIKGSYLHFKMIFLIIIAFILVLVQN